MIGRLRARYAAGRAAGLVGLLAASATLATLAVVSRRRRRSSRGQHVAIAAIAAVIAGCGSQDAELAKTSQPAGKHDIYRARLFTTELRGAARIPVHVDGTDGTSVDITADDDGRLCLTVPEINSEAGTASPRITADWSAVAAVRPAETTRFAHDEAAQRLSGAPGFAVAPEPIPGPGPERQPSLGVPQSRDWRAGADDAVQCHQIEHGHDRLVRNAATAITSHSYGPHDAALLTAARAMARNAADVIDACYRDTHDYRACAKRVRPGYRTLPGGFVNGPTVQLDNAGYRVTSASNAGTYVVFREGDGAQRTDHCAAIRVTTCPPGLAP